MWPGIDSRILRHMCVEFVGSILCSERFFPSPHKPTFAGVAQLASGRLSEQGVPSSILGDLNVCFDFPLIRVAIALNIRETEHRQRGQRRVKSAPSASIDTSFVTEGTTDVK